MSKNPVVETFTLGLCVGCQNKKSVLLKKFGNTCSEKCARTVIRRMEREAEQAALAEIEARRTAKQLTARLKEANARAQASGCGMRVIHIPVAPTVSEAQEIRTMLRAFEDSIAAAVQRHRNTLNAKAQCRR